MDFSFGFTMMAVELVVNILLVYTRITGDGDIRITGNSDTRTIK